VAVFCNDYGASAAGANVNSENEFAHESRSHGNFPNVRSRGIVARVCGVVIRGRDDGEEAHG
jgi:hypothetical protein